MKKWKLKNITGWVGLGFILLFVLLSVKLVLVMLHDAGTIKARAASQLTNESIIPAKRGNITDRNGNLLASSAASFQVDADLVSMRRAALKRTDLDEITKADETKIQQYVNQWAGQISDFIELDKEAVYRILTAKNSDGNYLAFGVLGRKEEISKLEPFKLFRKENSLNWLIFSDDSKRYYPNNNMLAQTLGILNGDDSGRFGIEAYYEDVLSGIDGLKISEVDKLAEDILLTEPIVTQPVDGNELVTTIDEKIQSIAEAAARGGLEKSKAKGVHIIVTNPKNGEILALVNSPDFDLNEPYVSNDGEKLLDAWKNKSIADVYEPGSTFKIVTMAAALSEGLVDEQDVFNCPGYTIVDGIRINCAKREGHGKQNYFDIFANSCNPGFIELGLRVGADNMEKWARKFGLGEELGIDLYGEAPGIVDFTSEKTDYALANKSIGQANLTTSLQLVNDLNTVINKGKRTTPHLMKEIRKKNNQGGFTTVSTYVETQSEDILDDQVADLMLDMLENSVNKGGGQLAKIPGLAVIGKTGTAQKVNPANGKYEFYVSSFVGAAPKEDPKISIFVAVDEPTQGSTYGSYVAAPIAKEIIEQSISYLNSPQN